MNMTNKRYKIDIGAMPFAIDNCTRNQSYLKVENNNLMCCLTMLDNHLHHQVYDTFPRKLIF